jgi:ribosome-binding factor A
MKRAESDVSFGSAVDYKLGQLCAQAQEALAFALYTSADEVLRDLLVLSVSSARGAALLRVYVSAETQTIEDLDYVVAKLNYAKGYLRAELARWIQRKRVPDLEFVAMAWAG